MVHLSCSIMYKWILTDRWTLCLAVSVTETAPTETTPSPPSPPQMPLIMQLYTSPDYRSPLDLNAKVQSDKRIYAEVRAFLFISLQHLPVLSNALPVPPPCPNSHPLSPAHLHICMTPNTQSKTLFDLQVLINVWGCSSIQERSWM